MSSDPYVSITYPVPISAQPHISRRRSDPEHFFTRRRRRDQHDTRGVMPLVGHYDAPRKRQRKNNTACKAHVEPSRLTHFGNHTELIRCLSITQSAQYR